MKSPLRSIKSRLPVSSRSFHAFEVHANAQLGLLVDELRVTRSELHTLQARHAELLQQLAAQQDAFARTFNHALERDMLLFWQLYRGQDEDLATAKTRFFRSLPRATGVDRLFQDSEKVLFREFDSLCREHDITYWAIGGTLLGAVRHGTMIPWDDDIDVAITRQDLERLKDIVIRDPRYRITEVWDWYVLCKQIRFRLSDADNPAFVDLFVHDAVGGDVLTARDTRNQTRGILESRLRERFSDSPWPDSPYLPSSSPLFREIDSVLAATQASLAADISIVSSFEEATGFVYGIENINETHDTGPYTVSDWLPTIRIPYDDFDITTLPAYDSYLTRLYGDYYRIPEDMSSHEHVAADYISSPESVAAMERFLGKTGHLSSRDGESSASAT